MSAWQNIDVRDFDPRVVEALRYLMSSGGGGPDALYSSHGFDLTDPRLNRQFSDVVSDPTTGFLTRSGIEDRIRERGERLDFEGSMRRPPKTFDPIQHDLIRAYQALGDQPSIPRHNALTHLLARNQDLAGPLGEPGAPRGVSLLGSSSLATALAHDRFGSGGLGLDVPLIKALSENFRNKGSTNRGGAEKVLRGILATQNEDVLSRLREAGLDEPFINDLLGTASDHPVIKSGRNDVPSITSLSYQGRSRLGDGRLVSVGGFNPGSKDFHGASFSARENLLRELAASHLTPGAKAVYSRPNAAGKSSVVPYPVGQVLGKYPGFKGSDNLRLLGELIYKLRQGGHDTTRSVIDPRNMSLIDRRTGRPFMDVLLEEQDGNLRVAGPRAPRVLEGLPPLEQQTTPSPTEPEALGRARRLAIEGDLEGDVDIRSRLGTARPAIFKDPDFPRIRSAEEGGATRLTPEELARVTATCMKPEELRNLDEQNARLGRVTRSPDSPPWIPRNLRVGSEGPPPVMGFDEPPPQALPAPRAQEPTRRGPAGSFPFGSDPALTRRVEQSARVSAERLLQELGSDSSVIEQARSAPLAELSRIVSDEYEQVLNRSGGRGRFAVRGTRESLGRAHDHVLRMLSRINPETGDVTAAPLEKVPSEYQGNQFAGQRAENRRAESRSGKPGWAPKTSLQYGGRTMSPSDVLTDFARVLATPASEDNATKNRAFNDPERGADVARDLRDRGSSAGLQTPIQAEALEIVRSLVPKRDARGDASDLGAGGKVNEVLRSFFSGDELSLLANKESIGSPKERHEAVRRLMKRSEFLRSLSSSVVSGLQDPRLAPMIRALHQEHGSNTHEFRLRMERLLRREGLSTGFFKNVPTHLEDDAFDDGPGRSRPRLRSGGPGQNIPDRPNLGRLTPGTYPDVVEEGARGVAERVARSPGERMWALGQHRQNLEFGLRRSGYTTLPSASSVPVEEDKRLLDAVANERRDRVERWLERKADAEGRVQVDKDVWGTLGRRNQQESLVKMAMRLGLQLHVGGRPVTPPNSAVAGAVIDEEVSRDRRVGERMTGKPKGRMLRQKIGTNVPRNIKEGMRDILGRSKDPLGALSNMYRMYRQEPDKLIARLRKIGVQVTDEDAVGRVLVRLMRRARKAGYRVVASPRAKGGALRGGLAGRIR